MCGKFPGIVCLLSAWLLALPVAARADVVLDPGKGTSVGYVAVTSTPYESFGVAPALPVSGSTSTTDGPETSVATYAFTATRFNLTLSQTRIGTLKATASSNGQVFFTPTDGSTSYTLYGNFTFDSPRAFLSVELDDLTSGQNYLYQQDLQNDVGSAGGSFTLDTSLTGMTGLLSPSDHYEFLWNAFIQAYPKTDSGATGGGKLGIAFTDPADAPLPSSVYAGLGLLGALGWWMRTRARRVGAK